MNTFRPFIFDTETTGIGPDKEAVEIGMLELDWDAKIIGAAQALLMPRGEISAEAHAVHGISREMLIEANAPCIEDWVQQTLGGRLDGKVGLIGHRVGFDRPLFAPIGDVETQLDTLSWAFELFPELPNKKLDTIKEHLGLEGGGESHRAMADCLTCHQFLLRVLEKKKVSLWDLFNTRFVVHYCPWGKHQGKRLMDVPRKYREWMLGLPDLDPNLKMSLEMLAALDPPPLVLRKPASKARPRIVIPKRAT